MAFAGFAREDFQVFAIPGLGPRMEALRAHLRPKLLALGEELAPVLSSVVGQALFAHVATHARRTVNPPEETWVAFGRDRRGYKAYAHFEVGLAREYAYVRFTVKPESVDKRALGEALAGRGAEMAAELAAVAAGEAGRHGRLVVYPKAAPPERIEAAGVDAKTLAELGQGLLEKKTAGFAAGLEVPSTEPVVAEGEAFAQLVQSTARHLAPLYRAAVAGVLVG